MQSLNVEYLANRQDLIPTLVEWTYNAWSKYDPNLTEINIFDSLKQKCNTTEIPIGFVLLSNNIPVGMANLKSTVKLAGYADRNLWLGSFWVVEEYKNNGGGEILLNTVLDKAREFGFKKLSDFESNPADAEWLQQHKWKKFNTDTYQNHPVTLLEFIL